MTPNLRAVSNRRPLLLTLADALRHVLGSVGVTDAEPEAKASGLRAIRYACGNITSYHNWKAYQAYTTVMINGPFSTGNVSYAGSTGIASLSGAAWPAWAAMAELRIGSQEHAVVQRISDTQVLLSSHSRPSKNLSGSFKLIQRRSPLPLDCKAIGKVFEIDDEIEATNIGAGTLGEVQSRFNEVASSYDFSAITGDERFYGLALNISPAPQQESYFRLIYDRYPRIPEIISVSTTAACTGTTVTAASSVFTERHVGCALRWGTADSMSGDGSISAERIITGYTSGTSVTVDIPLEIASSAAVISDVIDAHTEPMRAAILRLAEWELNRFTNSKDKQSRWAEFASQLNAAMVDDQRYTGPQSGSGMVASWRSIIGEVDVNP